ncbi:MAG TPA: tetratricopeptide repeat protein [Streptosporangiaceae bacterium]|nr:tetratricopeptide repeat protein [Streptosporangiaceae bacterium]
MTVTQEFVNFYEILPGIVETSNEESIRKAIRAQRQIWNKRAAQADPVKREQAQKRVRDLGEAERVLLNPARKREFDQQAQQQRPQANVAVETGNGGRDWLTLALEYFDGGNFASANYAAREALSQDGSNHKAWSVRANSSFNMGEFKDAGYEFREAIRLKPDSAEYHFEYGDAFAQLGTSESLTAARSEYEAALRIDPGNPVYRTSVANIQLRQGEQSQALAVMEEVVKEHPDVSAFQYYLALAIEAVQDSKWSQTRDGRLMITSEAQITMTREMSSRALRLKFDDDPLRKSLRRNLDLANAAAETKWFHSSVGGWGFALLISLALIAAHGVGIIFVIIVVALYTATHRRPQWKQNARNPAIVKRGI